MIMIINRYVVILTCELPLGEINDDQQVLEWMKDEETREFIGLIEEVNRAMLGNIIHKSLFVAVIFFGRTDAYLVFASARLDGYLLLIFKFSICL